MPLIQLSITRLPLALCWSLILVMTWNKDVKEMGWAW